MLSPAELQDLIHLKLPEEKAVEQLQKLTPEHIDLALLKNAVDCVKASAEPLPKMEVPILDCCGTGGSGLPHFNTSTTVALVLASMGFPVVKFGNRGFSSASGSFDLLEQLGFPEQIDPACLTEGIEKHKIAFLFAPQFYPKLAAFNRLRRTLKVRTLFNFIGPLLNPAQPAYQLLGVSHPHMQHQMARYLAEVEHCQKAWVVYGESGLDEIETQGETHLHQVIQTEVQISRLRPAQKTVTILQSAHNPADNLAILKRLADGSDQTSIYHHMVCLNAGAALHLTNHAPTWEAGVLAAETHLKSGQVTQTIEAARRFYAKYQR